MKLASKSLLHLALLSWTGLALIPFALIALLSLRNNADIYAHPLGIGGSYHLSNYSGAWNGPLDSQGMAVFFQNSLVAALAALVVNLGAGTTASYFATRLGPRARSWFLRGFLLGTVVPFVLLLIPYYQAYQALGILSSPLMTGVAYGTLALPTTVLVLHSFFVDFPRELSEAAAIDGLGDVRAYLRIVLPLSKGPIAAVSVLLLVWLWSETQLGIVLLQDPVSQTIPVGLLGFQGQFVSNLGPLFAGLTLASVPVIIIYLVFSRFITKGIALGGVFR